MIKLIIIGHPHLLPKHACGNHLFLFHFSPRECIIFITQRLNVITSIHSPNQEVPEHPQKYASILHAQMLYRVRPVNSTGHDCLVLVQFDLIDTYFYSR